MTKKMDTGLFLEHASFPYVGGDPVYDAVEDDVDDAVDDPVDDPV